MADTPDRVLFAPGSVVANRYEILEVIGRGGMGQVFRARDHRTGRVVAVKALHPKFSSDRDSVARFIREATLARQLDHPGIVKLYDTHNLGGQLLFSMEYVEGKTLRRWLSEVGQLDLASVVRVLCLVADALDHAHRITIHRDLSPENIMVLPDGSVRLLDFGLAKLDDRFKGLTMVGTNLGKLMYIAPEQEMNAAGVDHRADIYSLGIIFYELLAGCRPEPGKKLRDLRPDLPWEVEVFLRKTLARWPDDRFSSVMEFRAALLNLYRLQEEAGATAGAWGRFVFWMRGLFTRLGRA